MGTAHFLVEGDSEEQACVVWYYVVGILKTGSYFSFLSDRNVSFYMKKDPVKTFVHRWQKLARPL
jgi:hypothetical protein